MTLAIALYAALAIGTGLRAAWLLRDVPLVAPQQAWRVCAAVFLMTLGWPLVWAAVAVTTSSGDKA